MVDASKGENLGGEANYSDAVANVPDGSAADVYVDIGGLIEEAGGQIDSEAELLFDSAGIEPEEATAVASLVPGSEPGRGRPQLRPRRRQPALRRRLGAARDAAGDLGRRIRLGRFRQGLNEGIDRLDKAGIPSEGIGPNQLKKGLKQAGIDLESIASSIGDAGAFLTGNSEKTLGGALVLDTDNADRRRTPSPTSASSCARPAPPGSPRSAKARAASRSAARTSAASRWSSSPRAAGSRSATASPRPSPASRKQTRRSPTRLPTRKRWPLSATPRSRSTSTGPGASTSPTRWCPPAKKATKKRSLTCRRSNTWRSGPKPRTGLPTAKLIVGLK